MNQCTDCAHFKPKRKCYAPLARDPVDGSPGDCHMQRHGDPEDGLFPCCGPQGQWFTAAIESHSHSDPGGRPRRKVGIDR
jgi:hypothetical protein